VKTKKLDKLLETVLFEQPEEDEQDDQIEKPTVSAKGKADKETKKDANGDDEDLEKKDMKDIDKDDLDQEETPEGADIAVSIKINDNVEKGGKIKLIDRKKLTGITSIESILKLFDVDAEKVPEGFKDKMEITINSPLGDFKDQEYIITLMDKIGQLSISRPDFKNTITKKSKGNLEQAVQAGVGEQPAETEQEPEEQIDLSYLPELESEFLRAVKSEFFDRILERK
jgi:hypothetical protein